MRKVYKILLIALLLYSPTPLLRVQAQLLYEVSGNSAKAKSYILATNRFVDIALFDSILSSSSKGGLERVFLAFNQCERVITEFAIQDYEALSTLRQAALLPDSVRLRDCFTPTDYDYIKEACITLLNLNIDSLGLLKPSYLTELYRDELFRRWLFPDSLLPISTYFEILAEENNIPVVGLDNAGETMYISFDREPLAWQCRDLKYVIDYPEKEIAQAKSICQYYSNGRLNDISFLIASPDNESSVSYSDYRVFCQRNKQWVKRLTPYFKDGRTFITLDAMYLGGDEGLIAQIKAAGFRVKAVKTKH